jgi:hypothetical protein
MASSLRKSVSMSPRDARRKTVGKKPMFEASVFEELDTSTGPTDSYRSVNLSDEQVLAATAVHEAHGGVTAHVGLMLQRLSLVSHVPLQQLFDEHGVVESNFSIPLAQFLAIVRTVHERALTDEAFRLIQASMVHSNNSPFGSERGLTRAQRWAEMDAENAFEALHASVASQPAPGAEGHPVLSPTTSSAGRGRSHHSADSTALSSPRRESTAVFGTSTDNIDLAASRNGSGDNGAVLEQILEPMRQESFDDFRRHIIPREENPLYVRTFMRLGAVKTDVGYVLDTNELKNRCESIGLSTDEKQAVINLFDEDCSGDVDYEEFKAIMTGDLSGFGLAEVVVVALQKLLGHRVEERRGSESMRTADGNSPSAALSRMRRKSVSLFSRLGLPTMSTIAVANLRRKSLNNQGGRPGEKDASGGGAATGAMPDGDDMDDDDTDPAQRELRLWRACEALCSRAGRTRRRRKAWRSAWLSSRATSATAPRRAASGIPWRASSRPAPRRWTAAAGPARSRGRRVRGHSRRRRKKRWGTPIARSSVNRTSRWPSAASTAPVRRPRLHNMSIPNRTKKARCRPRDLQVSRMARLQCTAPASLRWCPPC